MDIASTSRPTIADGEHDTRPTVIDITSADYRFAYHRNPERFFRPRFYYGEKRRYRQILGRPALTTYENALYTPIVRDPKQRLGCLYDENLVRIEDSVTRRHLYDWVWNTDPPRYQEDTHDIPTYERPVIYLGYLRTQFGHFLIESISRWWPLLKAFDEFDRYVLHVRNASDLEKAHVKACFAAMNLDPEKLVFFDRPTRLKSVVVPEPSFQMASHAYSVHADLFRELALVFGADKVKPTDQPVFLSKRLVAQGTHKYIGEEELESYLEERGVRIVHPQKLSVPEQFRIVNEHKHIIGFQGSQLFSSGAALSPRTITMATGEKIEGAFLPFFKTFDHDCAFVRLSQNKHPVRSYLHLVREKVTGTIKPSHHDHFLMTHEVNLKRAKEWFAQSGVI